MTSRRPESGFTLIELMISLVLFSFAIAGVLAVAVSMSQGMREQRASVGTEGQVRVPLDFLADALRQLGPGSPTGNIQDVSITPCAIANVLIVTNNQTSITGGYTGWDKLEMIYASGAIVTGSRSVYNTGSTTLDVDDATGILAGDSIIISNTQVGTFVNVTAVSTNTLTLAAQCSGGAALTIPSGGYSTGSLVIRAQHAIFTINDQDGVPTLFMDPDAGGAATAEPLAEGVEDMQIAVGYDNNGNGYVDEGTPANTTDEWQYNVAGDSTAAFPGVLRAARITLIARATSQTIGNLTPFNRPAAEDHAAAAANTDKFRRRVLRSMVEIRNSSGSP